MFSDGPLEERGRRITPLRAVGTTADEILRAMAKDFDACMPGQAAPRFRRDGWCGPPEGAAGAPRTAGEER
jgi:hypothetical protein